MERTNKIKRFDENTVGWAGHAVNKQEAATSEFSKVSTHILQEFTCDTNKFTLSNVSILIFVKIEHLIILMGALNH